MTRRKKPTSTARTSFTQEFRETAVKLVHTGNKFIAEIARELELPAWKLHAWVDSAEKKRLTGKGGNDDGQLVTNLTVITQAKERGIKCVTK